MERRFFEFREMPNENDRVIEGVALRYGEVAVLPFGRESFEPGAFGDIGDVILNVQHDRLPEQMVAGWRLRIANPNCRCVQ